ncbi:F-box/FBD/LRR-repeat protein At1g13570-like [Lycium barbarum]|uniref:F-box/FBD/LRR-repeat protein At1g13570-like n=1 Tax=Lycium barbarum TaxID=112863 RepID=UPI00293E9E23|nr:F-box/FBD/LRR-repeat protein At1g13570-like [Lycium barbarum]
MISNQPPSWMTITLILGEKMPSVVSFYDDVPAPESLHVERFSNVTFNHLREVKSEGFVGSKPEMFLLGRTLSYMMLPKDKKNCSSTLPPDLLSNLPENVLDDILIRLPFRDAVRTSILSMKWRPDWSRLPVLTLDKTLWYTTNKYIPLAIRFTDIIYHLLALHVGRITKFILSIASMDNYLKVDNLISFLSRNGIQHLVLQFPKDNPYKLPSSFFTCSQMRHLSLHNCSFQLSPAFKGFNELVRLELYLVTISSELLGSLISWSPLLEKLALHISSIFNHVQINATKLKSFEFTGNIELLSLKKAPLLLKLSLVDTQTSVKAGQPNLAKYFESFPVLEHLHLDYSGALDQVAYEQSFPLLLIFLNVFADLSFVWMSYVSSHVLFA